MPNIKDEWGLPILPDPPEHKRPPRGETFDYWVKKISYHVYVNGCAQADFVEMLHDAWADAYAKGVRDTKR